MNSNLEAPRQSTGKGDYGASSGLKRKFPDKDEWRAILRQLQDAGELTFTEDRDEIVVPLPAVPDA